MDVELLVLVIGLHSDSEVEGRTRLQKTICGLKYGSKIPFEFEFHPYFYGPYSDDLTDVLNALVGIKLVDEKIAETGYGGYRYEYKLTDQGQKFFEKTERKLETNYPEVVETVRTEIKKLENLNSNDLVWYAKAVSGMPSLLR